MLHLLHVSGPALVGSGSVHFSVRDLDTVFMYPIFAAFSWDYYVIPVCTCSFFCYMCPRARIHSKTGLGQKHGTDLSFWIESISKPF
jgi:hypothetical protein